MSRSKRAGIAAETLEILQAGRYAPDPGIVVSLADELDRCIKGTKLFQPHELDIVLADARLSGDPSPRATIEVVNETTLAGIAALTEAGHGSVAALNFASAKNPGGGFLGGSQAQEESLARSSGLYHSLIKAWDFYEENRARSSLLYSDAMILSPDCPVFRNDDGALLSRTHLVSFISSAAPNAGALAQSDPSQLPLIPGVLRKRGRYVLALAASRGYRSLVLGAWGCGVFRNDPGMVAETFRALLDEGWGCRFERIRFSVLDTSSGIRIFNAFRRLLGGGSGSV